MMILALLLSLASNSRAAEMPSAFDAHYASSIERSLGADPFYASKLALSFDGHMAAIAQLPNAQAAAAYLKWQVAGPERLQSPQEAAARLKTGAVGEHEAGAILAAGAMAAPAQFNRVAARLENLKPGLGRGLVRSFHHAAQEARFPAVRAALQHMAGLLNISAPPTAYDSRVRGLALFDGGSSR